MTHAQCSLYCINIRTYIQYILHGCSATQLYVLKFIVSIFSQNYVCIYMYVCKKSTRIVSMCLQVGVYLCIQYCYLHSLKGSVTGEKNSDPEPVLGGSHG